MKEERKHFLFEEDIEARRGKGRRGLWILLCAVVIVGGVIAILICNHL